MTVVSPAQHARTAPPLARPRDTVLSGVSEGLARHLDWPVGIVRALFVATTAVWGLGALLYLWLWVLTPAEPAPVRGTRRTPVAALLLGVAAILLLVSIGRYHNGTGRAWLPPATLIPIYLAVALALTAGVWSALVDRR
ncbi:PspC domain-containing protein, partial [Microbacterium sp.]|uniref:PspC domain-containing protein n=1 Tax=Microbacterium sp. TaxID=51671 RepID=UPI002811D896